MITIKPLQTIEQLASLMPLFLQGYREMNKRYRAFECDEKGFIKTLVGVLGTPPNAIGIAWSDEEAVGYGVSFEDSPSYCDTRVMLLWALYVKPEYSKLASKQLFQAVEDHSRMNGFHILKAYNGRMNGSSISFFEKVFGMRRHRIEFNKQLS